MIREFELIDVSEIVKYEMYNIMARTAKRSYLQWVKTRPKIIQDLAKEFPFGTVFFLRDGTVLYLVGYHEDNLITLTDVNPSTLNVDLSKTHAPHVKRYQIDINELKKIKFKRKNRKYCE